MKTQIITDPSFDDYQPGIIYLSDGLLFEVAHNGDYRKGKPQMVNLWSARIERGFALGEPIKPHEKAKEILSALTDRQSLLAALKGLLKTSQNAAIARSFYVSAEEGEPGSAQEIYRHELAKRADEASIAEAEAIEIACKLIASAAAEPKAEGKG